MKPSILCLSLWLLVSCSSVNGDDRKAVETAEAWAEAYFNAAYHQAEEYVTPESTKWLRFAASNTTEADLQLLNRQHAVVASDDDFTVANDTLRVVALTVRNNLAPTTFDEAPSQQEESRYLITVVKRDDDWRVKMEGLPRSEKQSHDSALDE